MKIKYANKIYDVLYTMKVLGKLIYAVEDEPNHIDWLVNVEVIDEESKDEQIKEELIDYLKERKSGESYGQYVLRYDHWITWLEKQNKQKLIWDKFDDLMLKDLIEFIESGWSGNGKSHLIYWLKSIKDRIK